MNIQVDTSSAVPPYEQLRLQIRSMVASGALPEGTRLPSIRQLAGDLGLAVNTVGRAFRELENDGVIEARGRHGTRVTGGVALNNKERLRLVEQAAQAFALQVHHHGANLDEVLRAVRQAYLGLPDTGAKVDTDRSQA